MQPGQQLVGRQPGLADEHRVEERRLSRRAAHRIGLDGCRHGHVAEQRTELVGSGLQGSEPVSEVGTHGDSDPRHPRLRLIVTVTSSKETGQGSLRLVDDHLHALDPHVRQAGVSHALGQLLDEAYGLALDDGHHRRADRPVVDRVGQVVRRSGLREVEPQLHVDDELLALRLLVSRTSRADRSRAAP